MTIPDSFLFIINPNSGTAIGRHREKIANTILEFIKSQGLRGEILFTSHRGHATELVAQHINNNWRAVVAVGGDGTVNEVAKGLVNTDIPLGILPLGSGNGLARHLKLPLTLNAALKKLVSGKPVSIDTATINEKPFFCTAGVGFDAHVGYLFNQLETRGLQSYMSVSLKSLSTYKPQKYRVNGTETTVFSLSLANAGQYGNNAWIAPHASLQDGQLDMCTITPFPWWYGAGLVSRMFTKTLKPSRYIHYEPVKSVVIESEKPAIAHYDGEPWLLDTALIEIRVNPASLKVIV